MRDGIDPLAAEIDLLRVEVDPLRAEVDLLRLETDRLSAEVDPLRTATVLIVGASYAPQQTGFAPHTTAMARDLSTIAERVVVFTGASRSARSPFPRIPGQTRRTFEQDRGVHLVRHQHHVPSRPGGLSGARFERSFLRAVLATPLRNAPDLVIGVLPSVGGAVAAARVARRFGVPLLLVVQDLVAATTGEGGLVDAAVARRQTEALRQATRVILVGSGLRAAVMALGVERARIDVLADWTRALPKEQEPAAARARIGVTADELLVVYIGNIGFDQDVPILLRAARRIAGRSADRVADGGVTADSEVVIGKGLRLLLVGEGRQRQALQAAAADLPGVRFVDPVTASEYPVLLAAADVLVVTELPGVPDRTLPSRLESYLRAGRPVIAAINPHGDADRVLRTVPGAAVIVPAGDSGALVAVLIRLRDDERERARLMDAARGYADAAIRASGAVRGFRDVVRTVMTSRSVPVRTRKSGPR